MQATSWTEIYIFNAAQIHTFCVGSGGNPQGQEKCLDSEEEAILQLHFTMEKKVQEGEKTSFKNNFKKLGC